MGGSTSSNSSQFGISNTSGTSTQTPWSVQTPYLTSAFQRAEDAYNKTMSQGPYQGDYVAQATPENFAAFRQAFNFGTDATNNGYVQNSMDKANRLIDSGEANYNAGSQGLQNLSGDQTQNIINQAGQYADNPYMSGMLNAAMYDAKRQASESTIPNLYRSAAGANALNSDRAAMGQGMVERGLAEQALNTSAGMRYDAWNRGLGTAQNELNARRSGYQGLAQLGAAGETLGQAGLAQGIANQSRLNQMSGAGAEGLRAMDQLRLDNNLQKYQANINFPWQALNNYYNIIGNKSWGGTTNYNQTTTSYGQSNETTKKNPGISDIAGGIMSGIGGLMDGGGGGGAGGGLFGLLGLL